MDNTQYQILEKTKSLNLIFDNELRVVGEYNKNNILNADIYSHNKKIYSGAILLYKNKKNGLLMDGVATNLRDIHTGITYTGIIKNKKFVSGKMKLANGTIKYV